MDNNLQGTGQFCSCVEKKRQTLRIPSKMFEKKKKIINQEVLILED